MRVFVVNRCQDSVRREAISRQLSDLGLSFELVKAVDGRTLSEEEKHRLANFPKMRRVLRVLSDGEIGCAASHLSVYRKMMNEGIVEACILEDDARILFFDAEGLSCAGTRPCVRLLTDRRHGMVWTIGYVINRSAAAVMLKYNSPIWRVADCWESLARRKRLDVCWSTAPMVEPNRALGSVITPQGIPPHQVGLPGDLWSVLRRSCWRMCYGIGLRV